MTPFPSTQPPRSPSVAGVMTTTALLAALLLVSGCAFPRKDLASMPDPSVIQVVQTADGKWVAVPPDCTPLQQPSRYDNFNNRRMSVAFGCATYSNLAGSVARPTDLVAPRSYSGMHADSAGLAVQRYRVNEVEALRETQTTSVAGD